MTEHDAAELLYKRYNPAKRYKSFKYKEINEAEEIAKQSGCIGDDQKDYFEWAKDILEA